MPDIRVPTLGESVTEATIGQWFKKVGDTIAADEPLVELETDKVTIEVPAPSAGVLEAITAKQGDTVGVGALIGAIGDGVAQAKPVAAAAPAPAPAPAAAVAAEAAPLVRIPGASFGGMPPSPSAQKLMVESGLNVVEGSGKRGQVLKEDVLMAAGRSAGDGAAAYAPVAELVRETPAPATEPAAPAPAKVEAAPAPATQPVAAEAPQPPAEPAPASRPAPAQSARGPVPPEDIAREERVKMTRLRLTISRRLKEAQNTAAILTTQNEVDLKAVMDLRARYKDVFEKKHGVKLGFMGLFTKAVTQALKEIPSVNAEIDGEDVIYKNYAHIGVAVGTDRGLVVPVVRNADQLSIAEIEKEIGRLGKLARDGQLSMTDMQGGTFSISNGGVYGSLMSAPILNAPQSGILGMNKIEDRPVVVGGQIVIRPMMYIALSYDHRLIDGKEAVTFLVRVKESLEAPERLVLDL